MTRIVLKTVMDAFAARLEAAPAVVARTYPYLPEAVEVPAAVIGYPADIDFDVTFAGATSQSDEALFPIWIVVGRIVGKSSRDALSDLIAGSATTVKTRLEPNLDGAVQVCEVESCRPDTLSIAGIDYLAGRFDVRVFT